MSQFLDTWRRLFNLAAFLFCAASMGVALYLQYVEGMEPCPLCTFQRVAMMALGVVFLLAAIQHPSGWGRRVYAGLIALVSAAGVALAWRHLWLQSLPPDEVPTCSPGLDYLMEMFSFVEVIRTVLVGSGECAEVDIVFGLSIPAWTLIAFVGLGLGGLLVNGFSAKRRDYDW